MKSTTAWERFLAGEDPLLRVGRSLFRRLPSPPRCKLCLAPFAGIGRPLMSLIGKAPWKRNPKVCRFCADWLVRKGPGGAEVHAARLASAAHAGEILVSEAACRDAALDFAGLERRSLDLKGKADPVVAVVVKPTAGQTEHP